MFRAIKRIYEKTENHSYAGKRLEQSTKQNHNYAGKVNQDKKLHYQERSGRDKRQDDLTQDTGRHRLKYRRKWGTGGHNQGRSGQSH